MQTTSIFFILKSSTIEIPYKEEYNSYTKGDFIILKTDEFSEEIGIIQQIEQNTNKSDKIDLSGEILRQASERDLQKMEINKTKIESFKSEFQDNIEKMDLDMHLVSVQFSLDDSLIYLTFLSENRVDFRELVKTLAKKFQKKIHLQQIGPRDKSKLKGGLGLCGQEFCCKRFLTELPSVTMEAVRVQNMAYKGTEKLSGQCGKLMCCLNYESEQYREQIEKFPKFGSEIKYKNTKGVIIGLDILNQKVKIKFENHQIETISLSEIDK